MEIPGDGHHLITRRITESVKDWERYKDVKLRQWIPTRLP